MVLIAESRIRSMLVELWGYSMFVFRDGVDDDDERLYPTKESIGYLPSHSHPSFFDFVLC